MKSFKGKISAISLAVVCALSATTPAVARTSSRELQPQTVDNDYLTPASFQVKELSDHMMADVVVPPTTIGNGCGTSEAPATFNPRLIEGVGVNSGKSVEEWIYVLDQILNLGLQVWAVVEKGKPVVNLKTDAGTALPNGSKCWLDLQGWQKPRARTFLATLKNKLGNEVVSFKYKLMYVVGGNVGGKGKYIGFATLLPVETKISWGYNFTAEGAVPAVMNMGSHEAPIAGMVLSMKYNVESTLSNKSYAQSYFLDGEGNLEVTE